MGEDEDNRQVLSPVMIRPEDAADVAAVRRLVTAAFGRADEAELVDRLRPDALALVAIEGGGGAVVGHVMTSPMRGVDAVGLAPLAVAGPFRRRGVGARLVEAAIAAAREAGHGGVFVLGDPQYYGRFGFRADVAARFGCRYAGPHLMALELRPGALGPGGTVDYHRAFGG
ncbi:N-acetyltransferase [Acuticoccus sediminis]|uniref:N-acetyltransferase n=1 Tax=Acuticoccus sediminis TaxID=2184697 RepID=A0A8B2NWZ7_9HYPH|nr:N-acetyltransferase [Acuticoccus sediminis]RAI00227.1 N-acetyltransferase [Acuticoccus sediminis]